VTAAERRAVRVLLLAVAIVVDLMRGRRQDWLA
jgi:hypothetical protein